MPLPKPRQGESREDFVSRFMKNPQALQDFPEEDQRAAVAYNSYAGKTDKKEGGGQLHELTQELIDNLERKEFLLEIKEIDEKKGIIKAVASPYNNVDNGKDMVLPTIATRNVGKKAPFLLQHKMSTEMGDVTFYNSKEGLMAEIKLYLDKEDGVMIFPEAWRTYVIAQKGMLKVSIGYKTYDFEYKMINGVNVRLLKDIEIKELSRVTIPMNEKAVATEVKEDGGEPVNEENNNIESKEMVTMKAMMDGQMARNGMGMLMRTMRDMTYDMMNRPMKKAERLMNMGMIADEFAAMYKQYAEKVCAAMPDDEMPKSDIEELDLKFDELVLEEKAGAKLSKKTKAQMMKAMDDMMKGMEKLREMMGMYEEGKSSDDDSIETKEDQTPGEENEPSDELSQKEAQEALEALAEITRLSKGE